MCPCCPGREEERNGENYILKTEIMIFNAGVIEVK
jgi:hypothetical protein